MLFKHLKNNSIMINTENLLKEIKAIPIIKHSIEYPTIVFLLPIFLFAIIARFYGIDFGLPDLLHNDEPFEMHRALRLANGDFDFSRAGKGGLYYILFIEMGVTFFVLYLFGIVSDANQFATYFIENEHLFYLMGRMTSAVLGVASIFVIYVIGREMGGKKAGVITAFLLSICPLHIMNSHYSTVDVLMLFLMLLTWLNIFYIYKHGKKKYYILTGVFLAFSLITKLPAILMFVPVILAHILRITENKTNNNKNFYLRQKNLVLCIIISSFITIIGEPGYIKSNPLKGVVGLYSLQNASTEAQNERKNEDAVAQPGEFQNLYLLYFSVLRVNVGAIVLVIFIFSLIYGIIQQDKLLYLFISFSVPYFIAVCSTTTDLAFARYMLPIIPTIFLIIAKGITNFSKLVFVTNIKIQNRIIIPLFTILICYPIYGDTINSVSRFSKPNSRILAKQWINENIPSNSKIMMEDSPEHRSQFLVPIVNTRKNIEEMIGILRTREPGKALYWEKRSNYLNKIPIPRYDIHFIRGFFNWPTLDEIKKKKIEYIIIDTKDFSKKLNNSMANFLKTRIEFYNILKEDKNSELLVTFSRSNQTEGPDLAIYKISYMN